MGDTIILWEVVMSKRVLLFFFIAVFILFGKQTIAKAESIWGYEDFVIEKGVVYGFSKAGIEKLASNHSVELPSKDAEGKPVTKVGSFAFAYNKHTAIEEYGEENDVDGNKIEDIGEEFAKTDITSLTIPDGYTYVGQDAFIYNVKLSSIKFADTITYISEYAFGHCNIANLTLPKRLERIGDTGFFDSNIQGTLILPENLSSLGERAFKGNRLTDVIFKGNKIECISEQAFEDNNLKTVNIPDSINRIEEAAFNGNDGEAEYAYFVVLKTPNGENANNLPDKENYFINPSADKRVSKIELNYKKWDNRDFKFAGTAVTGFSGTGLLKVKVNKKVVIPRINNNNEPITEISDSAFRNVDFEGQSLNKLDIEAVTLPKSLKTIGDFAFQSNNITDVELGECEELVQIGQGAFMNNKIDTLELNKGLKVIDNAAFHINKLNAIIIPQSVEKIGSSAFRECEATTVIFEEGSNLSSLGEMAFLSNALESVTIPDGITFIPVQAFADNKLTEVNLPRNLKTIKEEAFSKNRLNEMNLPETVANIAFNSFTGNPDKVVIHTINGKNPSNLPDGDGHILDPHNYTDKSEDLIKVNNEIKALDKTALRESTVKQYEDMLKEGETLIDILNQGKLTVSKKLKFINDTRWFFTRIPLDKALKYATNTLQSPKTANKSDLKKLEAKIKYGETAYNNSAVVGNKLKRIEKELYYLGDLCNNIGEISKGYMAEGVYLLHTPLPIPEYYIGVNLYYDRQGKIIYVFDMSYTIGEGQKNEYGKEIENVDEDNQGYHEGALATLAMYEGLNVNDIVTKNIGDFSQIQYEDIYKYHAEGIFNAVKDAAKDAADNLKYKSNPAAPLVPIITTAVSDNSSRKESNDTLQDKKVDRENDNRLDIATEKIPLSSKAAINGVNKSIKTIRLSGFNGIINLKNLSINDVGVLKIHSKVLKRATINKAKYIVLQFKDYKVKLAVRGLSKLTINDKVIIFRFKKNPKNKKIRLSISSKKDRIIKDIKVK